jgi:hypothetical protein
MSNAGHPKLIITDETALPGLQFALEDSQLCDPGHPVFMHLDYSKIIIFTEQGPRSCAQPPKPED